MTRTDIAENIGKTLFDNYEGGNPDRYTKNFDRSLVLDSDWVEDVFRHYETDLEAGLGDGYDTIFTGWMEKLVDEMWDSGVQIFTDNLIDAYHNEMA